MASEVVAEVVEAFEINDSANDVYQHNFNHRPYQGNIQCLTAADLDRYNADAWLLSPPCQPLLDKKHSGDARAFSFLRILELIPHTANPPKMLFVENVVGFEAKRKPLSFQSQHNNNKLLWSPGPLYGRADPVEFGKYQAEEALENLVQFCEPVEKFLKSAPQIDGEPSGFDDSDNESKDCSGHEDDSVPDSVHRYLVPISLIERWGNAMDIVYPDSKRCCFTKSYYRYVKGTGSLLATVQPKIKGKESSLKEQWLRYFTEMRDQLCFNEN